MRRRARSHWLSSSRPFILAFLAGIGGRERELYRTLRRATPASYIQYPVSDVLRSNGKLEEGEKLGEEKRDGGVVGRRERSSKLEKRRGLGEVLACFEWEGARIRVWPDS